MNPSLGLPEMSKTISGFHAQRNKKCMTACMHIYGMEMRYISTSDLLLFRSNIRVDYSLQKSYETKNEMSRVGSPSAPDVNCNGTSWIGFEGNVCYVDLDTRLGEHVDRIRSTLTEHAFDARYCSCICPLNVQADMGDALTIFGRDIVCLS